MLLDNSRQRAGSTEESSNLNACPMLSNSNKSTKLNSAPEARINGFEVGSSVESARAETGHWIILGRTVLGIVDSDVVQLIDGEFLGNVHANSKEVGIDLSILDFSKNTTEPSETLGITTDPDEFNMSQSSKFPSPLSVPDMLQN